MTTSGEFDEFEDFRSDLHAVQQSCWDDLFAVAEGVAGLTVRRQANAVLVVGLGHAFSSAFWNQTLVAAAPKEGDLGRLARRVAALDELSEPYSLCLPVVGSDLTKKVEALGLVSGPILAQWAARPRRFEPDEKTPVFRIDAHRAADFLATLPEETPAIVRNWHGALVGRPGWDHFVAYVDDVPAAGAILYRHEQGGYLGWARTLPPFRRQGLQRALLQARLAHAAENGLTGVLAKILASCPEATSDENPSARNAHRMGFELVGLGRIWTPRAHAEAIFASIIGG